MEFIKNFPFFSIVLCMISATISSVLSGKNAKRLSMFVVSAVGVMSAFVLYYVVHTGESFVYLMGHHPAPWGNELRVGVLEGLMAFFFSIIMMLALLGGMKQIFKDVSENKLNLYFIMIDLLLASLLALIYTNDLFNAYVFIEINTLAACGLIMSKQNGRTLVGTMKYMVMSLVGSGLILFGLSILYGVTGHLLMPNIKESVIALAATGQYRVPVLVTITMVMVGLAIKSALYPFHNWLPDTYSYGTATSSALLSSLVSKSYIFLLLKIVYRVVGFEVIAGSGILNIFFVFGLAGMIMGSIRALAQNDIRKMIAYSSVAQIGYIYMGIGLGTKVGMYAAIFHIMSHAASKALLFISANGLSVASGNGKQFADLKGAGYRNKLAGFGFMVGSLSMVGIPMFAGFISKLNFALGAFESPAKMMPTLLCLAISTVLNAGYFIRAVIVLYTPEAKAEQPENSYKRDYAFIVSVVCFIILNFVLGMFSGPIMEAIRSGISMFA